MENPRENLRRAVRRVVHRACWRRLDGDEAGAHAMLENELSTTLAADGALAPSSEEVRHWIGDDEAEFDRAMLVSDLVARRMHRRVAPPEPVVAAAVAPAPVEFVDTSRPAARTAPTIGDLLDDMFAQERRATRSATGV